MALVSINISIINNNYKGWIEFNSVKKQNASNEIMYVLIFRRKHNTLENYVRVYEKVITNLNQLNFSDMDLSVRSGVSYDYRVELTDGNSTGYTIIEYGNINNVECWFDGLFIGNDKKQYFAPLDCNTSITRNTQAAYVTTLASRTPYRVSNSITNYTTGQSSGLFAPFDINKQIDVQYTKDYIEEVVDFLSNGEEKILKTSDGEAWYVSIDPGISVSSDDHYPGSSKIEFNWTEIGDVPVLKKVVSA